MDTLLAPLLFGTNNEEEGRKKKRSGEQEEKEDEPPLHFAAGFAPLHIRPVWFHLPENCLSENQDFLIIRCLKNLLSEESGMFGNHIS
jgi:hypothetical protein